MQKGKEVKTLKDLGIGASDFELPKLSELEGKEITITDATVREGKFGSYAVITLDNGSKYRTSNKVILKQISELIPHLSRYHITAKVKKQKNYYILE